MGDAIAASGRA